MANQSSKAWNMTWRWIISAVAFTVLFYGIVHIAAGQIITLTTIPGYYVRPPFPASELFWSAIVMALYAGIAAQITARFGNYCINYSVHIFLRIAFWFIFGVLSGMIFETFFGLPLELRFGIRIDNISFWILWGLIFGFMFPAFLGKTIDETSSWFPCLTLTAMFGYGFNFGFVLNMALRFHLLTAHWDVYWAYWLVKILFGLHAGLFFGLLFWLIVFFITAMRKQSFFGNIFNWLAGE